MGFIAIFDGMIGQMSHRYRPVIIIRQFDELSYNNMRARYIYRLIHIPEIFKFETFVFTDIHIVNNVSNAHLRAFHASIYIIKPFVKLCLNVYETC